MIRDPGKTIARHQQLATESCSGNYTPMRRCDVPCRRRRSIGQFTGASAVCNQCVRRAPKCEGVAL